MVMKKKWIALMLMLAMCVSILPVSSIKAAELEDEEIEGEILDEDEEDGEIATPLLADDLQVTPAKKTIKVGKSFYISIAPSDDSEWEDCSDEEWDEICAESIDKIEYRSSKSSVAYVNKTTGKVKGKKKGSAVISTTIYFANGTSTTLKTKVYVVNAS